MKVTGGLSVLIDIVVGLDFTTGELDFTTGELDCTTGELDPRKNTNTNNYYNTNIHRYKHIGLKLLGSKDSIM